MTNRILIILCVVLLGCQESVSPTLFQAVDTEISKVDFSNQLIENEDFNIIEYLYYYNGGGVAIGDINNDGLSDIYFTSNQGENKLYLNKGDLVFEDITTTAGIGGTGNWTNGVTMADVNGDGLLDIYVCNTGGYKNFEGRNQLFINQGDLTFVEEANAYGLDFEGFSTHAAFFDYDNDGDLDVYLVNHSVHRSSNRYKRENELNRPRDPQAGDRFFQNNGNRFIDVSERVGILGSRIGFGLSASLGDFNADGHTDIYVCNDFYENDYLYINTGKGTFEEQGTAYFTHTSNFSMGSAIGDLNNDGYTDLLTLDMKPEEETILKQSEGASAYDIFEFKHEFGYHHQFPRNNLQLNQGGKGFQEVGDLAGISATDWSWSTLINDLDNDGFQDVFITNGIVRRPNNLDYLKYQSNANLQAQMTDIELAMKMPEGKARNYVYKGDGFKKGYFKDSSEVWGLDHLGYSNGAAYSDLDNDGDLDIVVNNINETASIFENKATTYRPYNFVKVQLKATDKNTFGVGATIKVKTTKGIYTRYVYPNQGFQSASDYVQTIGIGKALLERIEVIWSDGTAQTIKANNKENERIVINKAVDIPEKAIPIVSTRPKEELFYPYQANKFIDFNIEKLQPYMLSTEGPKVVIEDFDLDNLEDVFVTSGRNQSCAYWIQDETGKLIPQSDSTFAKDKYFEDVDAAIVYANDDDYPDLYVVAGGNDDNARVVYDFQDRLYINDKNGGFTKGKLPELQANGGCAAAYDFDKDGDDDIFVGNRSIPGSYGLSPDSWLLINDGDGNFQKAENLFEELGMVTDAIWLDIDGDDWQDLIIIGEWMGITVYKNEKGKLVNYSIEAGFENTNGWWQTLYANDVNDDGHIDLIFGNFGLNSNLKPTVQTPLKLYVDDFDKNKKTDPLISYHRQGTDHFLYSKDMLIGQIASLKKKYVGYEEFSMASITDIFPSNTYQNAIYKEVHTLASMVAFNDGKGHFSIKALPWQAQVSPIKAIIKSGEGYLMGGNIYGVQPSIGRQDVMNGVIVSFDGNEVKAFNTDILNGEIRSLEWIYLNQEPNLLIGKNSGIYWSHW